MTLMKKTQDTSLARRTIPSLRSISAFEAAARTASFAKAAEDLSLSQSAISRQISQLEGSLGVELFSRVRQRVALTPAGEFFAEHVRDVMGRLRAAANETRAFKHGGGLLRLGVLPTFGARWLIPRVSNFLAAHPGVTLHFNTRLPGAFDFEGSDLDAAIHFGQPVWPGARLHLLRHDEIAVLAKPDLLRETAPETPVDLLRVPLISHRSRRDAWSEWLRANGVIKTPSPAIEFEQFTMVLQAAVSGLGFAIAPTFMARQEIDAGLLQRVFEPLVSRDRGDYLVYPIARESYPPLVAFRDWILAAMASDS